MRPAKEGDADALHTLAAQVGLGIYTLPKNPSQIEKKIALSIKAFKKSDSKIDEDYYLFLLEELPRKNIVGCSAIYAKTGNHRPLYSFKVVNEPLAGSECTGPSYRTLLHLQKATYGPAELCSLFLDQPHRQGGLGKLLSLSRLLFIIEFPNRFDKRVMARLRGVIDEEKNRAPFWEAVGEKFLGITFLQALAMMEKQIPFDETLFPRYPLYACMLGDEVQKLLDKPHERSLPAWRMLQQEGFEKAHEIDFLDGGPTIIAEIETLRARRESYCAKVAKIIASTDQRAPLHLISNQKIDFRSCLGVVTPLQRDAVTLSCDAAEALEVAIGDPIRYMSLHKLSE